MRITTLLLGAAIFVFGWFSMADQSQLAEPVPSYVCTSTDTDRCSDRWDNWRVVQR